MLKQSLLAELKLEAENTRKLFAAIPNDALDYKPSDFNWTTAQLASHIAELYNWWENTLYQDVLEMNTYKYDKGDISDIKFIREKLEETIAIAVKSLENYPEERLTQNWSMEYNGKVLMPPMPRIQVIRSFLMNHLYHHRGEMMTYLRAAGKTVPALYGPTYEDQLKMRQEM